MLTRQVSVSSPATPSPCLRCFIALDNLSDPPWQPPNSQVKYHPRFFLGVGGTDDRILAAPEAREKEHSRPKEPMGANLRPCTPALSCKTGETFSHNSYIFPSLDNKKIFVSNKLFVKTTVLPQSPSTPDPNPVMNKGEGH